MAKEAAKDADKGWWFVIMQVKIFHFARSEPVREKNASHDHQTAWVLGGYTNLWEDRMIVFSYGGWLPIRQSRKPYPNYIAGVGRQRRRRRRRLPHL
jgi:hypothetical protein